MFGPPDNVRSARLKDRCASLEVRIPISPRSDFLNRVRLIAQSIREFYPSAVVSVSVGSDTEPFDIVEIAPWSEELGVRWVWVPAAAYAEWSDTPYPFVATIVGRYRPPFLADHVLMLDADVLPVRPFDEIFERDHVLMGMMAHVSPFPKHADDWRELFAAYGLPEPSFDFELSGWGAMFTDPARRLSPPYFNSGVVFASADVFERLYEPYIDALRFLKERTSTYFFDQIAITLAISKKNIPFEVLPLRYNFPNQAAFDVAHPDELEKLILLHFLRTQAVDRETDFQSVEAIRKLIGRTDLTGSNEILRRRVAELLEKTLNRSSR
jgi:hypothetical protein